jgi:hypothetical protein
LPSHPRLAQLACLALLALLAGCAGTKAVPYDPFKVRRDLFFDSLKVVAMAPIRVPPDLENPDPVKGRFAATVEQRLRDAGLKVIPPSEVGPVLDAVAAERGGIYDPVTGKSDPAKTKAVGDEILRRLKERFGVDALLRTDIRVVHARLDHDVARWDGATEKAGTGFWKQVLTGTHSGRIPALSLVVVLVRADGTELYVMAGGLRVLSHIGIGGAHEVIPHAELFADEARNAEAVAIALDPLLGSSPRATSEPAAGKE